VNIIQAMTDRKLFGKSFEPSLLHGDTWKAHRVWLKALYGIPLANESGRAIYTKHTGRAADDFQLEPYREAFGIMGRKGGKTRTDALILSYNGVFGDHTEALKSGASVVCMAIATDMRQAAILISYCKSLFSTSSLLASEVESESTDAIILRSGVRIEVHSASFRGTRGYITPVAILDELAFFRSDESANPDSEVINAITPNQLTCPQPLLLGSSSPYAMRGELHRAYRKYFGVRGAKVLVWQAATRDMNPSASAALINLAYLRDAVKAAAEYGAQFRSDAESFLPLEEIEACVAKGRKSLPYQSGINYHFFTDAAAGGSDEFTLSAAHLENHSQRVVVDLIEGRHGKPEAIAVEFAGIIKRYHASEVTGDNFAKDWVAGAFEKCGVSYRRSEKNRSEIYLEFLPRVKSGSVELVDDTTTISQFADLERTPGHNRDVVDHPKSGHDDRSNSVAGAVVLAFAQGGALGALDYFSSGMAARELEHIQSGSVLRSVQKPSVISSGLRCPSCGAKENLRELSYGGEVRCGNCGFQFWPNGKPFVYRGGNRRSA
jgi:hypothetical protein